MKLADLLGDVGDEELEHLAHEHVRADERLSRAQLLGVIEGALKSYRYVLDLLINRQPPTFAMLTTLLDGDGYAHPTSEFRVAVTAETDRLATAIETGEILARDEQLRVYRRVLYQARSNDLLIDSAEASILSVLRQELGITQVEHFLIEHHPDLREFWRREGAFVRELHALRAAGVIFERSGQTMLAEELVPVLRRVLGLDMSRGDARRLYGYLSNAELHEALSEMRVPTSGSKEERIERLIAHMAQPRTVLRLRSIGVGRLRDLCRDIGAPVSGSKDELVDRVIAHVAADRDVRREVEPPPPIKEDRQLDEPRFRALFRRLRGLELAAILGDFDLRRGGSKDQQVRTLWEAHRAESSLLVALSAGELEGLLKRCGLKTSGAKAERIARAIQHFATLSLDVLVEVEADVDAEPEASRQAPLE